jgi:hypothetical protein
MGFRQRELAGVSAPVCRRVRRHDEACLDDSLRREIEASIHDRDEWSAIAPHLGEGLGNLPLAAIEGHDGDARRIGQQSCDGPHRAGPRPSSCPDDAKPTPPQRIDQRRPGTGCRAST